MKTRMFVSILILVLAVLIAIGSCATKRKVISDADFIDALSGTWVTDSTDVLNWTGQKWIIPPDLTYKIYLFANDEQYRCSGRLTISDTWIDSKGVVWFKATYKCDVHLVHYGPMFGKISESGKVWESTVAGGTVTIDEWDPDSNLTFYAIHYRQ